MSEHLYKAKGSLAHVRELLDAENPNQHLINQTLDIARVQAEVAQAEVLAEILALLNDQRNGRAPRDYGAE